VQVGVGGAFDVPMNAVVAKELRLVENVLPVA